MVFERISEFSASTRKDTRQVQPVSIGSTATNSSPTDDIECLQLVPTIEGGAQTSNPPPFFTFSSLSHSSQRSDRRNSIVIIDDSSSSESSSVVEIINPVKNHVRPSQRPPISTKRIITSISPSPPPPTSKLRVRAEVGPSPHSTDKTIFKPSSAIPPKTYSGQPSSISINGKISASKPTSRHRASIEAPDVPNTKSQPPLPSSPAEASTSMVALNGMPVFGYDLDRDPTVEVYQIDIDEFHEKSPHYGMLSARSIHARLFKKLPGSAPPNELTNSDGDLVTEFIEPEAISSVGPCYEVTPSYPVDSEELQVLDDIQPPPGGGDFGLDGTSHLMGPFPIMTIDDVINQHQPSVIDPSLLGGAPALPEPLSPSPAPTFRNFHSWKNERTPSPPLSQPALMIRAPPHPPTSISNPGGGKAKFYKQGTLQTPPHLSNSQSQRSRSTKPTPSAHVSRYPSPDHIGTPEIDSPLTEFSLLPNSTTSTSSVATPSEAVDTANDATVIGSGSGSSPPRTELATTGKQESSTGSKGPYRIIAVNESSFCHQCRRATPHPKMDCRSCTKRYCILCIVKRYHDIEFHQFKEDFDCPACLNKCNCTSCCSKRQETYVTTRHIKFDAKTMAKLLRGEIRSLPHPLASVTGKGPKPGQDPISSSYRQLPSTARKTKASTRRKRTLSQRYSSDNDDHYEDDASKYHSAGTRIKPSQAALQTQKMLEESGSGEYWGTVYSLSGERIGTSYVGNNLQDVRVQPTGFLPVSVRNHSPFQKRRSYIGRWQDAWGLHPVMNDSERETHTNKRSRNGKYLGHARSHYVGNQSIIKAWRRAQSNTIRSRPPVPLPPPDDVDIYLPSDPLPCDRPEAAEAPPDVGILIDEEDEDGSRGYWTMEDGLSPQETTIPLLSLVDIPGSHLGNIDVLDFCSTPTLESREQLVPQHALAEVVASSLEAIGTTVLLPQPSISLSTVGC